MSWSICRCWQPCLDPGLSLQLLFGPHIATAAAQAWRTEEERLTITMVCQISWPFCRFGAEFLQNDVHMIQKSYNKVLDTVYWSYETCLLIS